MESKVLTVMFTDIKGFTERTSQTSRTQLRELLQQHEELLLPVVRKFGGVLVKTIGDALLVTFTGPDAEAMAGSALASGDVDGDGTPDILIGVGQHDLDGCTRDIGAVLFSQRALVS